MTEPAFCCNITACKLSLNQMSTCRIINSQTIPPSSSLIIGCGQQIANNKCRCRQNSMWDETIILHVMLYCRYSWNWQLLATYYGNFNCLVPNSWNSHLYCVLPWNTMDTVLEWTCTLSPNVPLADFAVVIFDSHRSC